MKKHKTAADELAEIAGQENLGMPPALWAWYFGAEHAERNAGPDSPVLTEPQKCTLRAVAEAQVMRAFEAHSGTLPLRQTPSGLQWPKGPLPPKWSEWMYLTKAELRAWAAGHCPDLLGSALLAETAPESVPANPADEWRHATTARKRELAARAVEQHGSQTRAAQSLGISRQRIAMVLRNGGATVAPKFTLPSWKPRKP
jgi:hypothetical protein